MVLVPAVMQLVGSANWWLPRWLGRAIPNLAIEPSAVDLPADAPACTRPVSAEVPE
jgi:putative drug exporter of the RND superfamily